MKFFSGGEWSLSIQKTYTRHSQGRPGQVLKEVRLSRIRKIGESGDGNLRQKRRGGGGGDHQLGTGRAIEKTITSAPRPIERGGKSYMRREEKGSVDQSGKGRERSHSPCVEEKGRSSRILFFLRAIDADLEKNPD